MKFQLSIILCCILVSCSPGAIGTKESPAWHATASTEIKRAHFAEECKGFGYNDGTPEMNACIERQWTESKRSADANFKRKMQQASITSDKPVTNVSSSFSCRISSSGRYAYCDNGETLRISSSGRWLYGANASKCRVSSSGRRLYCN